MLRWLLRHWRSWFKPEPMSGQIWKFPGNLMVTVIETHCSRCNRRECHWGGAHVHAQPFNRDRQMYITRGMWFLYGELVEEDVRKALPGDTDREGRLSLI